MARQRVTLLISLLGISAVTTLSAATVSFSLAPSANISGAPGATIGWGFSVTNNSTLDYFAPTSLNADSFSNGTASLIFDILGLDLAPGATASEQFNAATGTGLYELTWDANAPIGFTNDGTFTLSGSFFQGDPNNGGTFDTFAPDALAPYSATVGMVPEPAALREWLLGFAVLVGGTRIASRSRTARR
jgi:hypothetical protein